MIYLDDLVVKDVVLYKETTTTTLQTLRLSSGDLVDAVKEEVYYVVEVNGKHTQYFIDHEEALMFYYEALKAHANHNKV